MFIDGRDRPMFYSKPEAAKYLKISAITLDRHRRRGAISYRKIGARVIFTQNDLDEFLDRCTVPAREGGAA
jgi:excisionase family DNA binding protein